MSIEAVEPVEPEFNVFFNKIRMSALVSCNLDPKTCGFLYKTKFTLRSFCNHPDAPEPDPPVDGMRICKTK